MQNIVLWLIVTFLLGMVVEWLLEIFFFRRRISQQIETLQATLRARQAELDGTKTQIGKLQVELNACTDARTGLEKQIGTLQADLKASTEGRAKLEIDLDSALKAKAAIAAAAQAHDAELGRVRKELGDMQSEKNSLFSNVQKFTASAASSAALVETWKGEKANLQAQVDKLNADLNASVSARSGLANEIGTLKAQVEKANADLNTSVSARSGLAKEIGTLKAQVEKANADLNACISTRTGLEKETGSLRVRAGQLEGDLATVQKGRVAFETDVKARDAELSKLRAELDDLRTQKSRSQLELDQLAAGSRTSVALAETLKSDKANLQARINQLDVDLQHATAERDRLAGELAQLRAQPAPTPAPAPALAAFATLRSRGEDDETPFATECPQHLSDVKGIGSVYEQRLYAAGIGSYWALSKLSNDELKHILDMTDLQRKRVDFDALRADARQLARQTKSLGREWSRGKPDDFEPLQGIGSVYEKRLYDAGICTYAALASATVEMLEEICHAPAHFKPDYASWIKRAATLAAKKAKADKA